MASRYQTPLSWGIRQITGPTTDAVLLGDARQWLKLDGTDEDGLVVPLITAARRMVEKRTNLVLLSSGWRLTLDRFPQAIGGQFAPCDLAAILEEGMIRLPRAPVSAVTAVGYLDTNGAAQVVASSDYVADLSSDPARIGLAFGKAWPATRAQIAAVTVDFTAGYSNSAAIPEDLKLAMKMLVAHWSENREAVVVGTINSALELAFDALVDTYKVWVA